MKELKYLDAATAELIENKVADACGLMKENVNVTSNPYQFGVIPCTQTSVYVQLPCLYDVLVGHEIKAIVEEIMSELNKENPLKGVFAFNFVRAREIYTLDSDGNEYQSGDDYNTATIGMMYYPVPSIGHVVKAIEHACKIRVGASTGLTFQCVDEMNKGHVVGIIESAIKALAEGEDYKGFKFTLTSCGTLSNACSCGPSVFGTKTIRNLSLKIEDTHKQEESLFETIFEYTIGEATNE